MGACVIQRQSLSKIHSSGLITQEKTSDREVIRSPLSFHFRFVAPKFGVNLLIPQRSDVE
jgi:hypothetical protein